MMTNIKSFFKYALIIIAFFALKTSVAQKADNRFVVVLDAGHGGHDPGKHAKSGYKEKDIALKIVLQVGTILEKNPNVKVVYTRKKDVFVELFKRGQIANKAKADLFVSVHCNAHHTQASGAETYVLGLHRNKTNFNVAKAENAVIFKEKDFEKKYNGFDPNSPESFIGLSLMQEEYLDQSTQLAKFIQKGFTGDLKRKNRGVKQAGFIVLHQTVMPSVLIETGFITNKSEGQYLNSKRGQTAISKSISRAIFNYIKTIDANFSHEDFQLKDNTHQAEANVVQDDNSYHKEHIVKNTIFKVQIAAGSKKIEPKSYNFKGLKNVSREKENKIYRYYYGYTSDYNKVKALKTKAREKGYKTAFVVAFRDGKLIKLSEVLKQDVN